MCAPWDFEETDGAGVGFSGNAAGGRIRMYLINWEQRLGILRRSGSVAKRQRSEHDKHSDGKTTDNTTSNKLQNYQKYPASTGKKGTFDHQLG